jgi:hypothetical protein
MGGSAFSPAFNTPRMPPEVYRHVRDDVHRKLRMLFKHVSTPIEAAAKADYGDVDVLVCEEMPWTEEWRGREKSIAEALASFLDAKDHKRDKESEGIQFALPWPDELKVESSSPASADQELSQSLEETSFVIDNNPDPPQPRFIQLDLHICPSLNVYAWQNFRCAHGDFWTIVGSAIRRYGLSFRNSGLYIPIADVEKVNKKLSLIKLSVEPREVLNFLFNDGAEQRFWRNDAFASVEEMCDFIRTQCRFYRPLTEKEMIGDVAEDAEALVQKKDRTCFVKRGSFRYWLEDYVPDHSPEDREKDFKGEYAGMKREEVAEMVKERFHVKKEYEENQKVGLRQMGVDGLWADIRSVIPPLERVLDAAHGPGLGVNFVLRTLRRKVSKETIELKDQQLDGVQRAYREGRFEEVKRWAEENWKEVAEKKKAENEEKSRIHYKAKMERVAAKAAAKERDMEGASVEAEGAREPQLETSRLGEKE